MDAEQLARHVWEWIGNHHDYGYTGDDLIQELERLGFPCPDDMRED